MKIGLISLFVAGSPILAVRISDGFSVGILDLLAPIIFLILVSRIPLILKSGLGLFFLALALSLTFSYLIGGIVNGLSVRDAAFARMVFILLPAALLITQPVSEQRIVRLTTLFFWGGGIAIIMGIALHHFGIQIRSDQQALWAGDGTGPKLRAGGVLGNSSDFGHLTAVWGSVCGLTAIAFGRGNRRYLLAAVIFLISLYATWIASSRAATLHLLLANGVALPFILGRGVWALMGCAAVLGVVIAPMLLSEFELILPQDVAYNIQRLDFLNLSGNSTFLQTGRFLNWIRLVGIYEDNWLFGIGYKNIHELYGIWGDNSYLTTFVEFGLIAGVANILFWLWLIAVSAVAAFTTRYGIVFVALVLSEALHGLTVDTGTIWYSMPLAWLFLTAHYLLFSRQRHVSRRKPIHRLDGQQQLSKV